MIHRRIAALAALAALAACARGEPPGEVPSADVWASREGLGTDQFVLVQPGTFEMGSVKGDADEVPVHTVNLTKAFWLQKTEVTQAQWQAVMGTNPSHFQDCGGACPVEFVSWDDAQAFIGKLNESNPGASYRLPTEAEWEYAARAGTSEEYGGTGVSEEMGWYRDNSGETTHPVGQKAPNAWGLYDMHGNVWEWVADWYGPYASETVSDPTGPAAGSARVMRGGSWFVSAYFTRSAVRDRYSPSYRLISFGFRLAKTP